MWALGVNRSSEGRTPKTVGAETPGSEDGNRQIEGFGRPSIVRGRDLQIGRRGTFGREKRKFLSVESQVLN